MRSSDSLSFPSEPPDLGNWFSSYAYQSPALSCADDFKYSGCSALEEIGDGKKERKEDFHEIGAAAKGEALLADEKVSSNGFLTSKRVTGHDNSTSEVAESADCLSHLSEPPDVRKWFSSYVYESPALDSCYDFRSSPIVDEIEEGENHAPNSNTENKEELINTTKEVELHDLEVQNTSSEGLIKRINCFGEKESQQHHFAKGSQKVDTNRNLAANKRPLNRLDGGHANKENATKIYAECGFISTRKCKQSEEENSFRKPIKDEFTLPPKGNKEAVATRKVLVESSNFQVPNVLEITGKWRCPQKNKPNLGPPFKQLRLEQWIRRV